MSTEPTSTTRVILAVVACVVIVFIWERFMGLRRDGGPPNKPAEQVRVEGARESRPGTGAGDKGTQDRSERGSRASGKKTRGESRKVLGPVVEDAQAKVAELSWKSAGIRIRVSERGAVLHSAVLQDPRFQERHAGKLRHVDLVQTAANDGPWPLQTTFVDSDFVVPDNARFSLVRQDDKQLEYRWQSDKVRVWKTLTFDQKRPLVWMTVKVDNLSDKALRQRMKVALFSTQGHSGGAGITNPYPRRPTALCYVNGELERRTAGAISGQRKSRGCGSAGCGMKSGKVVRIGQVRWIGSDDRYFLMALVPLDKQAEQLGCRLQLHRGSAKVSEAGLLFPEGKIEQGKSLVRKFAIFMGPKALERLDTVKAADGQDAELSKSIEFGWFALLCRPMLWLMKVFHSVVGNWGVAIILLTVLIKLVTLYWSSKSMRSMREMQRLKPKIDVLRERFKEDKQRLNQEMMNLYKVHKVSPLGGCLPMLIQMPVWFALYRTLGNAQELYRSGFLGWINDLTAADPYYVLPVLVGLAMFGQQAISPQPVEGAQAKMMKYFMPGMFTVFMMWLPSGLTVYIFVNTVLTMIHQWYMNKSDPNSNKDAKQGTATPAPSKSGPSGPGKMAGRELANGSKGGPGTRQASRRRATTGSARSGAAAGAVSSSGERGSGRGRSRRRKNR